MTSAVRQALIDAGQLVPIASGAAFAAEPARSGVLRIDAGARAAASRHIAQGPRDFVPFGLEAFMSEPPRRRGRP
jgi:hypothetical protein